MSIQFGGFDKSDSFSEKSVSSYDVPIPTRYPKALVDAMDFIVSNFYFRGKRLYSSRSNFIRSCIIKAIRADLRELNADGKFKGI